MNDKRPSANSVAIAKAKLRAIAQAERSLRRRLDDIEWRNTELKDALDNIDALAAAGEIPDFTVVMPRTNQKTLKRG